MRSSLQNRHVLILNKSWNAVGIATLERAITLLFSTFEGSDEPKAEIIDTSDSSLRTYTWEDWAELRVPDGDPGIRSAKEVFRTPKVIVLKRFNELPMQRIHFSRRTVYRRDDHRCQYCKKRFADSELSLDHVVPKSRGGLSTWENCVLSCVACNSRKADVMPKSFITEEKVKDKDGQDKIVKHHWFKVYFNDPKHPSITIKQPKKPKINIFKREVFEKEWKGFLTDELISEIYWSIELENDNPPEPE